MAYTKETYFKLRSRLDAFQTMALAYCLNAETDEEAQARMESLFKNLPTEELQNNLNGVQARGEGGGCPPEAPYQCGSFCLPYPCPTE
jgi:hypothetical protein